MKKTLVPGLSITYREVAKTINFGLIYGMSAKSLARTLKCSLEQAEKLLAAYFKLYPGVTRWLEETKRLTLSQMKSRTRSGRIRKYQLHQAPSRLMPGASKEEYDNWREANALYQVQRARVERQGMNTPIQGTSADITKLALALFNEQRRLDWKLVVVVHDELVVEAPEKDVDQASALLSECMLAACKEYLHHVSVPEIDVVASDHWQKE